MLKKRFNTISIINIEKGIVKTIKNYYIINKFEERNINIVLQ